MEMVTLTNSWRNNSLVKRLFPSPGNELLFLFPRSQSQALETIEQLLFNTGQRAEFSLEKDERTEATTRRDCDASARETFLPLH